ncbi:MAG TPA: helix-turn-helix transcriptional regulator [Chloroflexota bacterium]|nr:helix-turn-helix transcriptional regulator [Chloroflexota bacterium]
MAKDQGGGLGERVRKRRKALGMTAKSVAKAAGVSTSYISQVERGHQEDPSLPTLRRLADALSMDFHTLLGGQTLQLDETPIPVALQALGEEFGLSLDVVHMLSSIQIDGRQPWHREDWLFLLLAIRRACRILEPLQPAGEMLERGEKYALRG